MMILKKITCIFHLVYISSEPATNTYSMMDYLITNQSLYDLTNPFGHNFMSVLGSHKSTYLQFDITPCSYKSALILVLVLTSHLATNTLDSTLLGYAFFVVQAFFV